MGRKNGEPLALRLVAVKKARTSCRSCAANGAQKGANGTP
jgi:hypothetical protein